MHDSKVCLWHAVSCQHDQFLFEKVFTFEPVRGRAPQSSFWVDSTIKQLDSVVRYTVGIVSDIGIDLYQIEVEKDSSSGASPCRLVICAKHLQLLDMAQPANRTWIDVVAFEMTSVRKDVTLVTVAVVESARTVCVRCITSYSSSVHSISKPEGIEDCVASSCLAIGNDEAPIISILNVDKVTFHELQPR
jgi:hypothetical protein